jgi:hypothetical protein
LIAERIVTAAASGEGDLTALLRSGDTWSIS